MLHEDILTDITINAAEGSIRAHRAILSTRSPVFRSMFSHDLKEKELSTVDISDMSLDACQAFLNYIYGDLHSEEFLTNRLALLRAADKYDIADLKEACHESLLEDIDTSNVLERLQTAHCTSYQSSSTVALGSWWISGRCMRCMRTSTYSYRQQRGTWWLKCFTVFL
jgi:speckle-type POZ protein